MDYRRLGHSGLRVSVIGLGGNTFGRYVDAAGTAAIVNAAMDAGINFLDTADIYGHGKSEELLAQAIRPHREHLLIATKVGMKMGDEPNQDGSSRKRIIEGCEASLRRLQVDAIDLYQIHRFDPETPLEETLGALDDLVRAGKVRYIGCSQIPAWRIVEALWISDRRRYASYVSVQPEYNLLARDIEHDVLPVAREFGLGVIPFFPLGAGVLTGKYKPGEAPPAQTRGAENPGFKSRLTPETLERVQRLAAWAEERGHTAAEAALAWLAAQPGVSTIIAGARRPDQVTANARAADWKLSQEDVRAIDALMSGERQTVESA